MTDAWLAGGTPQAALPVPARRPLFGRLIRIGRTTALTPSAARYVVLSNILAWLGVLFTVGFAPVLLVSRTLLYPALQLVYALVYLPTLWLNHKHRYFAATTWLLLGSHIAVLSQVLVEGRGFDVQLFFMLHAVLPFLLYSPRHERATFALSALAGLDLIAVITLGPRLPQLGPPIPASALLVLKPVLLGGLFFTIGACAHYARQATRIAEEALDREHRRSEALLLNILPASIAQRLKADEGIIADRLADVTVLFADIVGFTTMSARMPPDRVVEILNKLFCAFDDLATARGLEKIKTIGDCYMLAGGLPEPLEGHTEIVADTGLEMLRIAREISAETGENIALRVGIHAGPIVAGVIGKRRFIYDMWGDTVNTASRMESLGVPGTVQVSAATHERLAPRFEMTQRGSIEVKGKGAMDVWLVERRRP